MAETLEERTWKHQRTNIACKMSVVNIEEIFSLEHPVGEKITGSGKKMDMWDAMGPSRGVIPANLSGAKSKKTTIYITRP
jgi:hypothetical protein